MELKIEHLSKQFKDKTAVNDVNLTLTPGVWGLLGANGAGMWNVFIHSQKNRRLSINNTKKNK